MYDSSSSLPHKREDSDMLNRHTDKVLNLIAALDDEKRNYLNKYLENAPISILEQIDIVDMKGGTTFIYEGEEIEKIYILVDGSVKATDQYRDGVSFEYMWFKPIKVFGTMEILLDMDTYRTSLTTVTNSRFLVISRRAFEKWINHDEKALRLEAKTMGTYLLTQAKMARAFLFFEGKQRVMVFIEATLDMNTGADSIRLSRQRIADSTGLSTRTVDRAIRELTADGYLRCRGGRLYISLEQRKRLKEATEDLWQGLNTWSRLL